MKNRKIITFLSLLIAVLAGGASSAGIFSEGGPGSYEYLSIRGQSINIYGKGVYHHMSADVAVQGIAQDYITLLVAIPLLLISLFYAAKGSLKGRFILAGVLNYFLITYLFYLEMAMYNQLFLVYVLLLSASFYAFLLVLFSFELRSLPSCFKRTTPVRFVGGFLIFNSVMIALLWLGVVVPPLLNGTVVPLAVAHYTTLTVQGLDLALFLPACFIAGYLVIKKERTGYLLATVTVVFLSLLMTALCAKIAAMAHTGVNVVPAVFVIPTITLLSYASALVMINGLNINNAID